MPPAEAPARAGFKMLDVRVGETIELVSVDNQRISVTIHAKDGQRVRLGVKAGPNVVVQQPSRRQP